MRKVATASAREISAEKLADLKYNALGIMTNCRKAILQRFPFIGSIAMNLDLIPTRDDRIPTACTDGESIYFDIDFLRGLKPEEQMFVIAHEIWHNVLLHSVRLESRQHSLFNIATDLEVNQLLIKDGFIEPEDGCYPKSRKHPNGFDVPPDLNAEQYYELLLKQQQFKQMNGIGGESADGDSKDGNGSGNSNGELKGQFDVHVFKDESLQDTPSKNLADSYGKVGHDPDYRPNVTESKVERVREMAIIAAQTLERQQGTLPAHLKSIVSKLLEPEINWKEQLAAHVTRVMGEKSNWNHPNRRFAYSGTYLPSHEGDKLKIAVGIDTSGSTKQDLSRFLGELNGLVNSFGNYELHVIQCDAAVQDYKMYDETNPLELETAEFEMHGGGGTRLTPVFDYIRDNCLDIDVCCLFTDGECEEFNDNSIVNYPVLWLISKNGTEKHIHFGDIVKFI